MSELGYERELAAAREVGMWAAERLRSAQPEAGKALGIQEKGAGDWFSALDAEIEDVLRKRLLRQFPGDHFLGEESGGASLGVGSLAGQRTWVVDPIDGSMNFLRAYPQYSVSLALLFEGQPVVACIVDPTRLEVFTAVKGHGARCGDRPLKASGTRELGRALAATVFPKPTAPFMDAYLGELGRVLRRCAGLRRSGSMALELAYLAAGRIDAFWERGMGAWDAAAGMLLVQEAGGVVWPMDGRPWFESDELAASSPALRVSWEACLRDAD